jgi:hypothetical protein
MDCSAQPFQTGRIGQKKSQDCALSTSVREDSLDVIRRAGNPELPASCTV